MATDQIERPVSRTARMYIPVAQPSLGPYERDAVEQVLASGWISQGPEVEAFEWEFAEANGHYGGAACNSGTTALQLALVAAGVKPGDRVACPTLTMIAVPNAIRFCGAEPVFVDSRPEDGNPNWDEPKPITIRQIAAVIAPHLYGSPAEGLYVGVPVISDCAEAHYSEAARDQRPFASTFSFFANKIITTGEGGMVVADNYETLERVRSLRAHAFTPGRHFHHTELAFSYRMTDLQAALGRAQNKRHQFLLESRRNAAKLYDEALEGIPALEWRESFDKEVWWVYPLLVRRGSRLTRDQLRNKLAARGIETRSYFVPCHQQPHLRQFAEGTYPVAEDLSARGFYLGCYPDLTAEQIQYTADSIRSILK